MGCDIHCHSEVKIGGIWHHLDSLRIHRDYELFALMAGVRNWVGGPTPIAEPRGLPIDVALVTQVDSDAWDVDGHSHSWLSSDEVPRLFELKDKNFDWEYKEVGYLFGNGYVDFKKYPEDFPADVEDYRWVFWFDN